MLGSLIAGLATGETQAILQRTRRALISYALAGLLALFGIVWLLVAGTIWAARRYGAIEATLAIGGIFLILALLVFVVHKITSRARAKAAARRRNRDLAKAAIAAGIGVAPTLLRGRVGIVTLLAPAIAALAYAVYRENSKPGPFDSLKRE
jgi:hypothetical protein